MTRPRDNQRSRMYAADREAFDNFYSPDYEIMKDVQAFVDKVTASKTWLKIRFIRHIKASDGRRRRRACARGLHNIIMPKWTRSKHMILHEMAHCATLERGRSDHGQEFCCNYLKLVSRFLGVEQAKRLRLAFRVNKVKYTISS
jgi:putative metallohydrolase (TIGR04338 family)